MTILNNHWRARRRAFEASVPDAQLEHLVGPGSGLYGYEVLDEDDQRAHYRPGRYAKPMYWVVSPQGVERAAKCSRCSLVLGNTQLTPRRWCRDCARDGELYALWSEVDDLACRMSKAHAKIVKKYERESHRIAADFENKWRKAWREQDDEAMMAVVGYTFVALRDHLQRQFRRGMSWDNYGLGRFPGKSDRKRRRSWHIDHIVPKSTFDLRDQRTAYALTNLRPLWDLENFAKAARRLHLL